jgi:tetratricopeptide (TPR) repeat protein
MGLVDAYLGHVEQAEQLQRESVVLMRTGGDRAGLAAATEGVAVVTRMAGKFTEAAALMEHCLYLWDEMGTRRTTVIQNLGRAILHLGQYERAIRIGQEELALTRERDQRRIAGMYLDVLGMAALPRGTYEEACRLLQEALAIFGELGARAWRANTEAVVGYAARGIGRPEQAQVHLLEALCLGRKLQSWWPVVLALPAIALLMVDSGQVARAVELYALALTFPYVANSRWFEDIAGREIASASASLYPEMVDAAKERGRARDRWVTVEELLEELEAK